jgi:hypothetical protein
MAKPNIVSKAAIVKYVKEAFDREDIERVWEYLGKKFGFNVPAWKIDFENSFLDSRRDGSIQDQFMEFGKKKIEPVLNDVLCRKDFPTWIKLLGFLLQDKINTLQNRDRSFKNRYG